MNLLEAYQRARKKSETVSYPEGFFEGWMEGSKKDVLSEDGRSDYYKWLTALMITEKPKQVVELGGAMGASALCILEGLSSGKLYTITLAEHGLEYSFISQGYPQLVKIVGDDLDLANWPKDLDFSKTDILFIDTEHTGEQLQKELDLYLPLLSPNTLVILDDIKFNNGMWEVWRAIKYPKLDVSDLHHSGFGLFHT